MSKRWPILGHVEEGDPTERGSKMANKGYSFKEEAQNQPQFLCYGERNILIRLLRFLNSQSSRNCIPVNVILNLFKNCTFQIFVLNITQLQEETV